MGAVIDMSVDDSGSEATASGVARASAHLRDLLSTPGPYREAWLRYSERWRGGLHQAAIAAVLSTHLWETGRVSDSDTVLPRRLKDRVSRSLSGRTLSPSMLRLFIDAFEIADEEARQLWTLLLDDGSNAPVIAPTTPLSGEAGRVHSHGYETLAVHDFHRIGADRFPVEHRTVQVIRATEGLETFQLRFDTDAAAVQVLRGGRAAGLTPSGVPGQHAVDVALTQPLRPGETASLEYRLVFAYRELPEPVMRRLVPDEGTDAQVHVTFDPTALPVRVEWCQWKADRLGMDQISAEVVLPNREGEVHRYVSSSRGTGVGFRWAW